jgi:hypothetical protein
METNGNKNARCTFTCEKCDVRCSNQSSYNRHILSTRHVRKQISEVHARCVMKCQECDYVCSRVDNYNRHISTHVSARKQNEVQVRCDIILCHICNRMYKTRAGLWKHGKICKPTTVDQVKQDPTLMTHVMDKLIKQNDMLSKQNDKLYQQQENLVSVIERISNQPVNINSNNKQFNLNFFLNEQCKDAINWKDFLNSITLSLNDLDISGNITDKVTHTICNELEQIGLYRRPIHCLDIKRKRMCIKDENEWKKDSDELFRAGISNVSSKYKQLLMDWSVTNKGWQDDQKLTEEYTSLVNAYMNTPDTDKCFNTVYKKIPV